MHHDDLSTAAETSMGTSTFLRALRGDATDRRPVWMMRQAGRYLPEYLELRSRVSFLDLCHTPELACEATLQPIRRFGFDAAILFSDILVPLEPMGAPFVFTDVGPRLETPLRSAEAIDALCPTPAAETLGFVGDAVRLLKKELGPTPLIGFAGAPWTLAAYLVEGGGSQTFQHIKTMLFSEPALAMLLLDKLTEQVTDHLRLQIEAGCDAVQVFDTWAGILSPADYERFILPRLQRIFAALAGTGVPRILFMKGGLPFLDSLTAAGADAIGLDWTMPIEAVLPRLGATPVQGNLDPIALFGSEFEIRRRTREILRAGDEAAGHVFNLGHGILPGTPISGVETMLETVREWRPGVAS